MEMKVRGIPKGYPNLSDILHRPFPAIQGRQGRKMNPPDDGAGRGWGQFGGVSGAGLIKRMFGLL